MSNNKVYGDAPNELPLVELPTRFDYAAPEDYQGIDETCRIERYETRAQCLCAEFHLLLGRYF